MIAYDNTSFRIQPDAHCEIYMHGDGCRMPALPGSGLFPQLLNDKANVHLSYF
jgi:hypothetical protein